MEVSLQVGTSEEATAAAGRTVRAMAGVQMEVSCTGTAGPYAAECVLSSWTFQAFGSRYKAVKRVWARPQAGSTRQAWEVTFDGESVSPRRERVSALRVAPVPSTGPVNLFEGRVILRLGNSTTQFSPGGAPETRMTLPVRAWANADYLLLHDESRVLSATGKLRLNRFGNNAEFGWLPSQTASGDRTVVDAMTASLGYSTFTGAPASAMALSGWFRLGLGGTSIEADYVLSRVTGSTITSCSATQPCAGGLVCEQGLQACVPGAPWTSLYEGTYQSRNFWTRNTIVQEQRKAWHDSGAQQLAAAPGQFGLREDQLAQGILCQSGDSQNPVLPFARNVLPHSGDLACATGLPPFLSRLQTQRDLQAAVPSTPVLNSQQMLQACLADLQKLPAGSYSTNVQAFFQARLQTPGQCFSAARLFDALTVLGTQPQSTRDRLRWYLLQQWVGVHTFVARQVLEQRGSYDFLGDTASWQVPALAGVLDQLERSWELLLEPTAPGHGYEYGAHFGCGFRNPDYRLPTRPVGAWKPSTGGMAQTRMFQQHHVSEGRDLTLLWYPDPSRQNACDEHVSEACSLDPESCPEDGRCGLGFYNILAFDEGSDGDFANKFYIHKYGYQYMTAPDEALVVEHIAGGQRYHASFMLPWMNWRLEDAPFALRRRSGQYQLRDSQESPPITKSPWRLSPAGFSQPYSDEDPPAGDSEESTTGIVLWDFAMTEQEMTEAFQRSLPAFTEVTSDLLPPAGHQAHHEQAIGLPTSVLEGLTAHLGLLEAELDRVSRQTSCADVSPTSERGQALERYARTLRQALTLEARASAQHGTALASPFCPGSSGMTPGLEARWKQARAALEVARSRVQERFAKLRECLPVGIPEDEAPLYFRSVSGASERFFASSDYIFGYAQAALGQAEADLTAARTAWDQQRTSTLQQQLTETEAQRRLENLKAEYGRPLVEMCGLDVEAKDALALFDPSRSDALHPETCYVARQTPECNVSPSALYAAVTREQARYAMCVWYGLHVTKEVVLPSPLLEVAGGWATAQVSGGMVTANGKKFEVRQLYQPPFSVDRVTEATLAGFQQQCSGSLGGMHMLPAPSDLGKTFSNTCFRGELGTLRLGITAASQSMQVARSNWTDAQERYDIAARRCQTLVEDGAKRMALIHAHEALINDLVGSKALADRINQGVDSFNRAAGAAGQGAAIGTSIGGPIGGAIGLIVGAGLGFFGAHAADESILLGEQIAAAEQHFNTRMVELELAESVKQCFYDAQVQMVGVKTAALQVERALTDVEQALLGMRNMQQRISQLSQEGLAAVRREEGRRVPSLAHHYWLDERIAASKDSFQWAHRLSYLLALSLEYEMQQSLQERREVLAAGGPAALRTAFNKLAQLKFAGKVGGRFPGEVSVTLSLRDDVLKLASHEGAPSGERAHTAGERFARRISSLENAVFDGQGRYLGQGIRFTMPVPNGLALRCAERLWSVRANLQAGDTGTWQTANGAQLLLYKRNTFHSHWCDSLGRGDGSDYQVRVSRPSLDLTGLATPHDAAATSAWSSASVQSKINMDGSVWASLTCTPQNGCTDELAGRGFFGDYLLLLPYQGLLAQGFPATAVEDVMLRFEVVSVSNAPDPDALLTHEAPAL